MYNNIVAKAVRGNKHLARTFNEMRRILLISPASNEFLTNRAWHRAVIGGQDVILRRASALEHLQLWVGYLHENKIDVYAKCRGEYENVNYCVVDSFDGIDYVRFGDVLCTSSSQTFNDMLADCDNIDELALVEGLAEYYHSHNKSFEELDIWPENIERLTELVDLAADYHKWG
jgi:hypothetical protein